MGILRNGMFGNFENRTGPLVGRVIRKRNVITAVQHRSSREKTQRQLDQQLKFALVSAFLKRFKGLIAVGFANVDRRHAFNAAVKYNFRKIVIGDSPAYGIDYSKLVYSRGCLAGPNSPSVTVQTDSLLISWLPHAQSQLNRYSDRASFLVYCPERQITVIFAGPVNRASLGFELALPVGLTAFPMHLYMSFVSADGKEVSNSMYLGMI
ncbi:hypothetical protein HDC92_000574 [Pedobacter sp. AK017]|uniref:DUF6266 family protein n=1 Tax=Pedobacter sp. AK017 TaxID=2723073 RepID=UPI00160E9083|nr:DUF6266 family protein [Pedobacter sp. AK017]MBB5436910.1 hypothetical protein [Pedobacter sp. AK017]